jgi:hypothetical protein
MGILRTDKISGLETPTAVTGSVVFDGSGDYLQITPDEDFAFGNSDFTIETWAYFDTVSASSGQIYEGRPSGTQGAYVSLYFSADNTFSFYTDSAVKISGTVIASRWYHIALVRNSGTTTLYFDGVSQGTYSDSQSYVVRTDGPIIGVSRSGSGNPLDGYLSNYRILKGTALYTSDFTVPTHELEVIGDTVLLCCNNSDSAGAASYAGIGTSKTITVNGNAAASTFSPGLIKDFTYGTEFKGVTTFDTQGYFVPPSGTTTDRDRTGGRGLVCGGQITPASESESNHIDYITISSTGNSQDFGDLTDGRFKLGASGSSTRGIVAGGATPARSDIMDFVTIAATGNALDFGDLLNARDELGGAGNNIRALFFTGSAPGSTNVIEYVTTAALGNAQDFGDLTRDEREGCGCGSPTRGIIFVKDNSINYLTWATTGNALDFGDTGFGDNGDNMAVSDRTRAIIAGGFQGPASSSNGIHYLTISTLGNTQDFGDLTATSTMGSAMSNSIRGVFSLGESGGVQSNAMDYVTIQTTGDAKDFGDLISGKIKEGSACSDSHGAIG